MKSTEHSRTRHFNIMLVVLAVVGLIAALIAIDPLARASQGLYGGWAGHHNTRGTAMAFCNGDPDDQLGQVTTQLITWLNLDTAQKTAWVGVERERGRGLAKLHDVCGNLSGVDAPATMPERLVLMESAMAAGTEALRSVRTAFAEFYGTLDENQRRNIDGFSIHHGFGVR